MYRVNIFSESLYDIHSQGYMYRLATILKPHITQVSLEHQNISKSDHNICTPSIRPASNIRSVGIFKQRTPAAIHSVDLNLVGRISF